MSAFYENMVDDSGRSDCTRAAMALQKAVKREIIMQLVPRICNDVDKLQCVLRPASPDVGY